MKTKTNEGHRGGHPRTEPRLARGWLRALSVGWRLVEHCRPHRGGAKVTIGGKRGLVEVFSADGKWYARDGYEMYGENVAPYNDGEIELLFVELEGADK